MATVVVRDAVNARVSEPILSWNWNSMRPCTAAALIEERVRTECDRVAAGIQPSEFLTELSFDLEKMTDAIVARALEAFRRGKIILIVNDTQVTGIDDEIALTDAADAVFLKLVPLKGG